MFILLSSNKEIKIMNTYKLFYSNNFSCALLELWNDGTPALDLPGLLAYRNGEDRPNTMTLPDLIEPELRNLLHSMTERNPKDRRSAELYLDEARGTYVVEVFFFFQLHAVSRIKQGRQRKLTFCRFPETLRDESWNSMPRFCFGTRANK